MCQPGCNTWPGCMKERDPEETDGISCYGMYEGLSVYWMGLMFG